MSEAPYESQFAAVVCESFAKLCGDYRLPVASRGRLRVVFANEHVELVVAQKHIWDSVWVAIGLKGSGELYDLDVLTEWSEAEPVPLQIGDVRILRKQLGQVANLLRERGNDILIGREDAFAAVELLNATRNAAYDKKMMVNPILARARHAWQAHDYGLVVNPLSSVIVDLPDVERLRLRLAAKYLEEMS